MICCCKSDDVENTVPTQLDQKVTPAEENSVGDVDDSFLEVVEEEDSVSNGGSSADQRPPSSTHSNDDDESVTEPPTIDPSATNINTDGHQEGPPTGWGNNNTSEDDDNNDNDTDPTSAKGSRPANMDNAPDMYIDGTRKDQGISSDVADRIKGLEDAGLETTKRMGRKMLTPRIITDVKEMWDKEGNITREMTHYIEEPDGTKRTEKETVYIAAGDVEDDDEIEVYDDENEVDPAAVEEEEEEKEEGQEVSELIYEDEVDPAAEEEEEDEEKEEGQEVSELVDQQ